MSSGTFPNDLRTRPASPSDISAIANLYEVTETADFGEPQTSVDDIAATFAAPDFSSDEDSILVFDDDALVAYGETYFWRADVAIHPDWRSRGIGGAMLDWTEQNTLRRRPPGEEARIGQTIIDSNATAVDLFLSRGYARRHTSWALRLPRDVEIEERPLPGGYRIDVADLDTQQEQIYRVIEDAFNEWPNRKPTTFEGWQAWTTNRPDFDPSLLFVALRGEDVVGASVGLVYPDEGWVHQIAVQSAHRNLGLAKGLLARSFQEMRSRGLPDVGLSTDSRTGALDLYLGIGMVVRQSFTHFSKLLRPEPATKQ